VKDGWVRRKERKEGRGRVERKEEREKDGREGEVG
jgi:hypothetical protein